MTEGIMWLKSLITRADIFEIFTKKPNHYFLYFRRSHNLMNKGRKQLGVVSKIAVGH